MNPNISSATGPMPFGADSNRRVYRIRGYTQVVNVKTDLGFVNLAKTRMEKRGDKCYYQKQKVARRPTGNFAGQEAVAYGYEWVGIARPEAYSLINGPVMRNPTDMDTRMPVVPALNGVEGKYSADVLRAVFPMCLIELPGRDKPSIGGTGVLAGVVTLTSTIENIYMGDLIMVVPPDNEEVDKIKSRSGDNANGANGRVPFVMKRFDPTRTDFLRRTTLMRVLFNNVLRIEQAADGADLVFNIRGWNPATREFDVSQMPAANALERNDNRIAGNLLVGLMDQLLLTGGAANDTAALKKAVIFCVLSGLSSEQLNTAFEQKRIFDLFTSANSFTNAADKTGLSEARYKNAAAKFIADLKVAMAVAGASDIYKNNPMQRVLSALGQKHQDLLRCVKAVALTDLLYGKDGEVHLLNQ